MFAGLLQRVILGPGEYLKHSDLDKMTNRSPFSSYLNYLAYDPKLETYLNQDGSLGLVWECSPVIYAGPKIMAALEGLFRTGLPKDSVIQLLFHADSHIEPILEQHQKNRSRTETIVSSNSDAVVSFLIKGKKGLMACSNIPVRNFRLFVAVKMPGNNKESGVSDDFTSIEKTAPLLDIKRQIEDLATIHNNNNKTKHYIKQSP